MNNVFIIAEAGVNHNGKLDLAYKLCDVAKYAGVDAVKFQTFKTENVLTRSIGLAEYQKSNLQQEVTQFEMVKELELNYDEFRKIKDYCESIGLSFLSTPDDDESLEFLNSININPIKVGSGEIDNLPFLKKIGECGKDVILSTGMSYLADVEKAYLTLLESGANSIILLHCTSNYPCPMDEVNLSAMLTLKAAFKTKIGYSDHTLGIEVAIAAVALGAEIIEKHFTLDKNMEGPDHKASLDPEELKQMVISIRNIERSIGSGLKRPNKSELKTREVVSKVIVAKKNIKKGDVFSEDNIVCKRAGKGISPALWDEVINKIALHDFEPDTIIEI